MSLMHQTRVMLRKLPAADLPGAASHRHVVTSAVQKNGVLRAFFIASHRWLGTVLGAFTATSIVTGILDEQRTMWDFGYFNGMPGE